MSTIVATPRRRRPAGSTAPGMDAGWPAWARWNRSRGQRYTIGAEEELMLLTQHDQSPAQSSDQVLARLSRELAQHATPETHAAVIELATGVHGDVGEAVVELASLRAALARELDRIGLCAASTGTFPLDAGEVRLSASARYQSLGDSMRMLARRDPTMALHVHVGIPDPDDAIRVLNGFAELVPIMLALSANSPFCRGRDSGFASARTVIFQAFPRTGIPRHFLDYCDYAAAVDRLIGSGALPDPSFLWWDVRLQPGLGTVEVRVMDAQSTLADSAPLIALVQSLAALILDERAPAAPTAPEVLAENRFLAARDGMNARLIDPATRQLTPVRSRLDAIIDRCTPYAITLGCNGELRQISRLAAAGGADRQRARATQAGLPGLVASLAQQFGCPV